MRVSQEPGRPVAFLRPTTGTGKTGPELSRPAVAVSIRCRSVAIDTVGYGCATRKERSRKRQRESERCVVPLKPGNRPDWTRWREGGVGNRNRRGGT